MIYCRNCGKIKKEKKVMLRELRAGTKIKIGNKIGIKTNETAWAGGGFGMYYNVKFQNGEKIGYPSDELVELV